MTDMSNLSQDKTSLRKHLDDSFLPIYHALDNVVARLDILLDMMYRDHPELVDWRKGEINNPLGKYGD